MFSSSGCICISVLSIHGLRAKKCDRSHKSEKNSRDYGCGKIFLVVKRCALPYNNFLGAVDTAEEKSAYQTLIAEVRSDVLTIDQLISFTESPDGAAVFGARQAGDLAAAARQAKAQGETTCICPACQAGKEIIENQGAFAS